MNAISNYSNGAELTFAAYATLSKGIPSEDYLNALKDKDVGMTDAQAKDFIAR